MKFNLIFIRLMSLALIPVLIACNTATSTPTPVPPTNPVVPATSPTPAAPTPTLSPTEGVEQGVASVAVEANGLAQEVMSWVVEAVPPSADNPWWVTMPAYTLLSLNGYPIAGHMRQPQIFVYPVQGLEVNEAALNVVDSLRALLQTQQAGETLPYLPLYNELQLMHAQVKYLDFKDGTGVRYLTEYGQGLMPVNNHVLFYTYQGLTGDGRYYVAGVLPIHLSSLPANENDLANLPLEYTTDFPTYLVNTINMLNQLPADAYTPDLNQLDAMMQSIDLN